MKFLLFLILLALACASMTTSYDLFVGNSFNARLVHSEMVKSRPSPYRRRAKTFFYSSPQEQKIKGIIARDLGNTEATVTVTAGSVGFPYVRLRLVSERGTRLNYSIEIYT